ncbi:carbohydrate-binding family 9-like protein [Pontibacter korlensis]|uniref:carbohydrate-binding family 9-like protein n=1 Tax=Pontibacter korlensis TaxID=400092 RepID=UPI000698062E|nr:carbohydrate-binding family 9-like protein [Pontibacter korlensis]
MKHLTVPFIPDLPHESPLALVSDRLDQLPAQYLEVALWTNGEPLPKVAFVMAHGQDCLYLKYKVEEETVLARYRSINEPVYKDSCVEFFLSFGDDGTYYNLEVNCLGTCLLAYGRGRDNRKLLPASIVSAIEHLAHLKVCNHGCTGKAWELTLRIPAWVFSEHQLERFSGLQARGNFYKCGEDLPAPHYLAWQPIEAPEPDFHRPEQFGRISFASASFDSINKHIS